MDPRVLDAMLPFLTEQYGNPHSRTHSFGWDAEKAVEHARAVRGPKRGAPCSAAALTACPLRARASSPPRRPRTLPGCTPAPQQVANMIGANPREIIFTSVRAALERRGQGAGPWRGRREVLTLWPPAQGATESNNMAVKGIANFYRGRKNHVITTQTEHKCVLDSCRYLEQQGWDVTYLPVQENGILDVEDLKAAIRPDTALVSVMGVNNEIGVVQPLADIGKVCRENKVFFHSDCAQMVGKMPVDVNDLNIDVMSISGHKLYGPKGVGAWR